MNKKLTITLDEQVYEGLYKVIGKRNISQFIESLIRPHVIYYDLETAYSQMAQDEENEAEALEWIEATLEEMLSQVNQENLHGETETGPAVGKEIW